MLNILPDTPQTCSMSYVTSECPTRRTHWWKACLGYERRLCYIKTQSVFSTSNVDNLLGMEPSCELRKDSISCLELWQGPGTISEKHGNMFFRLHFHGIWVAMWQLYWWGCFIMDSSCAWAFTYWKRHSFIINHFYFSFIENTRTYVIMMCIDVINKFHFRILNSVTSFFE